MARNKNTDATNMSLHNCTCGAKAVDKFRGEYLCRECLMGPNEQPKISLMPSNAGAIETKSEFIDSMVINRALTKFMKKHGMPTGKWTSDKFRF
jgi:hypothetical protein